MAIAPGVEVFRAVADPTRRAILDRLAAGESSVAELAQPFAMSLPAISQHLKVLREAGLVSGRREGRRRLYRLEARPLRAVSEWVEHYERFWRRRMVSLGRHLEGNP